MESYLKHYKMKLKTLAPLYIGSGKEVTKKQYIFANNKIYVVDVPKFLKFIADKNLTDKYMTFLQNDDPRIKLKDFLEKYGIRSENVYLDKASGKNFERPAYQKMLKMVKKAMLLL